MMGSPWLEEYERRRPVFALSEDENVDVAIVGGGISGLLTAYFILEKTDLSAAVLERELVGHGATGHNGGQVVAAFERRHDDLSDALGEERTAQSYRELGQAWGTLSEALADIGQPPLRMVTAQLGVASKENLEYWAHEIGDRRQLGLSGGALKVANDISPPDGMEGIERVSREELDRLLWSRGGRFIAAMETKVGLMNSYALAEELAENILAKYSDRFKVWERSPVERLVMVNGGSALISGDHRVRARSTVLCTNGYRHPDIESEVPAAIEGRMQGVIGYMVGMTSRSGRAGARAYFLGGKEPYFYLTRREHADAWLTAVGGPEDQVGEHPLSRSQETEAFRRIEEFIENDLAGHQGFRDHYWLGLMGYTPSGLRAVGRDPNLPGLYYNLGCNGIGLLSAVAGADRLAKMMAGEEVAPSAFDPETSLLLRKEKVAQRAR